MAAIDKLFPAVSFIMDGRSLGVRLPLHVALYQSAVRKDTALRIHLAARVTPGQCHILQLGSVFFSISQVSPPLQSSDLKAGRVKDATHTHTLCPQRKKFKVMLFLGAAAAAPVSRGLLIFRTTLALKPVETM